MVFGSDTINSRTSFQVGLRSLYLVDVRFRCPSKSTTTYGLEVPCPSLGSKSRASTTSTISFRTTPPGGCRGGDVEFIPNHSLISKLFLELVVVGVKEKQTGWPLIAAKRVVDNVVLCVFLFF
uniref:Uncharacterized protein n=1 Tax=Opuntia streptacantha TaxID=393608 RepID=A0A7C9DAH9_OPUST